MKAVVLGAYTTALMKSMNDSGPAAGTHDAPCRREDVGQVRTGI